jgi:hypothetical protein
MKFKSLKLLADENISPKVVTFLREQGIDVLNNLKKELNSSINPNNRI